MDVWFSLVIGLLFLLLGGACFPIWHRSKGRTTPTSSGAREPRKAGQEVTPDELEPEKRKEYDAHSRGERQQALTDGSMFLFGVALLVDAGTRLLAWLGLPGRRAILRAGDPRDAGGGRVQRLHGRRT